MGGFGFVSLTATSSIGLCAFGPEPEEGGCFAAAHPAKLSTSTAAAPSETNFIAFINMYLRNIFCVTGMNARRKRRLPFPL
jgi:hypothetical protein